MKTRRFLAQQSEVRGLHPGTQIFSGVVVSKASIDYDKLDIDRLNR